MKNSILILTIFLLFTGCTFKQQRIDINHYSIDFKTQKKFSNKTILAREIAGVPPNTSLTTSRK